MRWFNRDLTPMKIGTVPHTVLVHGSDKPVMPGKWVRIKETEGDKWHRVLVDRVNPDGHVFAKR